MIGLRFTIADESQYVRRFDMLADEVTHLKEPLARVSARLTQTVTEQFDSQGAHGLGSRWTPLSDPYRAWKAAAYPGKGILDRTGAMRDAFVHHGQRELTDNRLVWGVDTQLDDDGQPIGPYAAAHQSGEGHVPQRKIVALTNEDRRAFDHEFVAWFNAVKHSILGKGPL